MQLRHNIQMMAVKVQKKAHWSDRWANKPHLSLQPMIPFQEASFHLMKHATLHSPTLLQLRYFTGGCDNIFWAVCMTLSAYELFQLQEEANKLPQVQAEDSIKSSCAAFESLQNAAKLLSMGSSTTQFCSQLHGLLQSQCKLQPLYVGQQYGKSF